MFLASTGRKWRAPLFCRIHWGSNRHMCMHTNWIVTTMCVIAPSAFFTVREWFFLQFLVFNVCYLDLDNICRFESLLVLGAINSHRTRFCFEKRQTWTPNLISCEVALQWLYRKSAIQIILNWINRPMTQARWSKMSVLHRKTMEM